MFKLIFLIFFIFPNRFLNAQQCANNEYNPNQQADSATCLIWGNYNLKTFDDYGIQFQSTCTFTALEFKTGNGDFKVDFGGKDKRDCERDKSGCFTFIKFLYNNVNYHLYLDDTRNPAITVDGNADTLPYDKNKLRVHQPGERVVIEFIGFGVEIRWDKKLVIQITVDNNKPYKVRGLCGDKDKCSSNDMQLKNGATAKDADTFLRGYQVDIQSCAEVDTTSPCRRKSRRDEAHNACRMIKEEKVFAGARAIVNPELYYQACLWTHCDCAGDKKACVCDSFDSFTKASIAAGLTAPPEWRTDGLCSKNQMCAGDLEYRECLPPTGGLQCADKTAIAVTKCEGGCYCLRDTYSFGTECFSMTACPCWYNRKRYEAGQSFPQDCNTCTCINGDWDCTKKTCLKETVAWGDPHYTSWDGKKFDFMGQCAYYLVKAKDFSIAADQYVYKHGKFIKDKSNAPSYMRTIIVKSQGITIELKPGLEVVVDGVPVKRLPGQVGNIVISKPSSYFVLVVLPNKVQVEWDGTWTVKIRIPTTMRGKVAGLFGSYTDNQADDFMMPSGAIAPDVTTFGNSWKTEDSCVDAPPQSNKHPCEVNPSAKAPAEKICQAITGNIFEKCQLEDKDVFFDNCVYDACYCKDNINECACTGIAAFAAGCAQTKTIVNWRNKIPQCRKPCPAGLVYQECGNPCERSCEDLSLRPTCEATCVEGCNCAPGTTLNEDGKCIPIDQCKCRKDGILYPPGYKLRENDDEIQTCEKTKWITTKASSEEKKKIVVVDKQNEVCGKKNELSVYTPCLPMQELTCQNMHEYEVQSVDVCREGCQCKNGYILDLVSRSCVRPDDCPCVEKGRSYEVGSVFVEDCSKCTCTKDNDWDCQDMECEKLCPKENEVKKIDCNTCTCIKAEWSCTKIDCQALTCSPNNKIEKRDCNTCECVNGFWECTNNVCECSANEVKHEGCKTCTCENGNWKCNEDNCPDKCPQEGAVTKDGCNTCECVQGYWQCTNKICANECEENARKEVGCKSCVCQGGTWNCNEENCIKCNAENEIMVQESGKCICQNGEWKCMDAQCHIWGDSHIKPFGGVQYDFQGECNYILASGRVDDTEFKITFLNERCSNAGATCLKSFTVTASTAAGGSEALTFDKDIGLPNTKALKNFIVTDKILQVTIEIVGAGIQIFWDAKTWVYVKLDSKWQGKVDGLCGKNNKGKSALDIDFRVTDDKVLAFVDLWRTNGDCNPAQPIVNTCSNERAKWAQEECSILLSKTFMPCHEKVPVEKYHQACVTDSCKCDLGGDCECLCTAIAMYAQECNNYNVPIAWRTQKLCPMQCPEKTVYDPCISSCPEKTCETIRNNAITECVDISCTEGCAPKKLPPGHVYTDSTHEKSVPEPVCTEPTCNANGKVYFEGDIVKTSDCEVCVCKGGKSVCRDICDTGVTEVTPVPPTKPTSRNQTLENTTKPTNPGEKPTPTSPTGEETPAKPVTDQVTRVTPTKAPTGSERTEPPGESTEGPIVTVAPTKPPEIPCDKVRCPPLKCPSFAKELKLDGQCCPCCQHEKRCYVNVTSTNKLKLKMPGKSWSDGPCRECTCEGNQLYKFIAACKTKICHKITGNSVMTKDIYYEFGRGPCCPTIKPVSCVYNDKVYRVGEEWTVDKCTIMKCVHDATSSRIVKETTTEYCNENCPAGYTYEKSGAACCGRCVENSCHFNGKARSVGERWQSPDGCTSYICNKANNQYVIMSQTTICPALEYCSGDVRKGRCCSYCGTSELFAWQQEPSQCSPSAPIPEAS